MTASERRNAILEILCMRRVEKINNLAFQFGVSEKNDPSRHFNAVARISDLHSPRQRRRNLCRQKFQIR